MGDEADAMWDREMIDEGYEATKESNEAEKQRIRAAYRRIHANQLNRSPFRKSKP